MKARIIIAGDLCPIGANESSFAGGTIIDEIGNGAELIRKSDFSIANLECPLIRRPEPIRKSGPVIGAPISTIRGINDLALQAVCIANNHIMDHGPQGLQSTLEVLEGSDIHVLGAGSNLSEARMPLLVEPAGIPVVILSSAEREFTIAGKDTHGANPIDPARLVLSIVEHSMQGHFIIVLLHAGKEYFPYPTPSLQDLCHTLIKAGAHCIVCQHSHCAGAIEHHLHGLILFGQGNFLFDWETQRPSSWYEGFLLQLEIERGGQFEYSLHPFMQQQGKPGITMLEEYKAQEFHQRLIDLGSEASNADTLASRWAEFCRTEKDKCFAVLRGSGKLARFVNRKTGYSAALYSDDVLRTLLNLIRCESHRETVLTVIEDIIISRNQS